MRLILTSLAFLIALSSRASDLPLDWQTVDDPTNLCGGFYVAPILPAGREEIEARADESNFDGDDRIQLFGDAQIWNEQLALSAERISFFRTSGDGDAEGDVTLRDPRFVIQGDSASLNLYTGRVDLRASRWAAHDLHIRGQAERALRDGAGVIRLNRVRYSLCAPGDNAWSLSARRLKIDRNTGRGYAQNTVLRVKDVPVLWVPILGFPVDDRRLTGFLFPTLSLEKNADGDYEPEIEAPFYWNINPRTDMLITPRLVAERGAMLETENRYLFDNLSQVELKTGQLPQDDLTGQDRESIRLTWRTETGQPIAASADIGWASDEKYEDELGGLATPSDENFPNVEFQLAYRQPNRTYSLTLDSYTRANDTQAPPYKELPRFAVTATETLANATLNWSGEYSRFDRAREDFSGRAADTGTRLTAQARLSQRLANTWGFVEPAVLAYANSYNLERAGDRETTPGAFVPGFSLDSGITLEKIFDSGTRHLIEPRAKYLNVAHVDQTDQPVFDTGSVGFSFSQLFADRAFSGNDRFADTQQVSVGIANRVLSPEGGQRFRFDVGQSFYLADRRVGLGETEAANTDPRSPLVGEARANFAQFWSVGSEFTLNDHLRTTSASTDLKYRESADRLATLRVRFANDEPTSHEASALWNLGYRWRIGAGYAFNHTARKTQNFAWGLEYESCCWRAAVVQSYDRPDFTESASRSVTLQFQLKGLGMIGSSAITALRDNIESYEPRPVSY